MQSCNTCQGRPAFLLSTYKEIGEGRKKIKMHGSSTICFNCYSKEMEKGRYDNTRLELRPLAKSVNEDWDEKELKEKKLEDCTSKELFKRAQLAEEELEYWMEWGRKRSMEAWNLERENKELKKRLDDT